MSMTAEEFALDVRRAVRDRMVGTPLGDTDDELARRGLTMAEDIWGRETITQWARPNFAKVPWTSEIERDEAVLTMGEHRNHIRDEGRAAYEAWRAAEEAGNTELAERLKKRAGGLLWAVMESGRLIGRLGATPLGEPIAISQIDAVNLAVGLDTYQDIILDHHRGMKRLIDSVADAGELTAFFDRDFTQLAHTHWDMEGSFGGNIELWEETRSGDDTDSPY